MASITEKKEVFATAIYCSLNLIKGKLQQKRIKAACTLLVRNLHIHYICIHTVKWMEINYFTDVTEMRKARRQDDTQRIIFSK